MKLDCGFGPAVIAQTMGEQLSSRPEVAANPDFCTGDIA